MRIEKALLAFVIGLVLVLLGCGFPGDIPHKSDSEMIANFRVNKVAFENLLQMVRHDEELIGKRFFRIDDDWTGPENLEEYGIDNARVRDYRRIFYEIGIPRGFHAYGEGKFYIFVSSSQGLAVSGSSKSYVWSEHPPEILINEDLDSYHPEIGNDADVVYRSIEGNWYLQRAW